MLKTTVSHKDIIVPLQVPSPDDFFSEVHGISPSGDYLVGTAGQQLRGGNPLSGDYHGFANRTATGDIHPFDIPGASATSFVGCNDLHDIVGFFRSAQNEIRGFVWLDGQAKPRVFTDEISGSVPVPITPTDGFVHNSVLDINNHGLVVGTYRDSAKTRDVGFVARADEPATAIQVDARDALSTAPGIDSTKISSTTVLGINNKNEIVGAYVMDGQSIPFKWAVRIISNKLQLSGSLIRLEHPGIDVVAKGINDRGEIVGNDHAANLPNDSVHGFLWFPNEAGNYPPDDLHLWELDVPSTLSPGTLPHKSFANCIDNAGSLAGAYRKQDVSNNPAMPKPPNRRAFIGSVWMKWLGNVLQIPFYPPIPNRPFPPFPWWSVPLFGASLPASQDVAAASILMQLSAITNPEIRERMRALVIKMLQAELRTADHPTGESDY